jgi:GT2 family glycosyltransferase
MHWFLKLLIYPLLEALRPGTIVEVGVEVGTVTGPLLRWARANGAVVHAIDPDPTLNVGRLEAQYGEQLRFYRRKSLEVLEEIAAVDVALIDGDHNWYTVLNELRALERRAARDGREPPVMLLHDVGWPYGRRDLYYDPRSIPESQRQPYARGGVKPGRSELGAGLNDHLENALLEGTPANGVLSAVEDFIATSERPWRMWQIAGLSGMAMVASEPLLKDHPALRELLEATAGPAFLKAQCEAIEVARIDAELKRANIQRRLAETQLKQVVRSEDPREKVELQRRIRELTERVEELEEEGEGRAALEELVRAMGGTVARLEAEAMAAAGGAGANHPPGGGAEGGVLPDSGASSAPGGGAKGGAVADTEAQEAQSAAGREEDALVEGAANPGARTEREAWQTLLSEYVPLLEGALPCADERDPLSLPCPLDVRGILREAGAEQAPGEPSVDVVVCVHGALAEVRECLGSVLAKTDRPLRLIVVNDGSDAATSGFLRAFADRHPLVTLIHREEPPHGYTLAANRGIEASEGDYVVLLNSDTVVTPGWLARMVACGESHREVGIVGPLSNAASHQSVPAVREGSAWATNPLPSWMTADGVAMIVAAGARGAATPLPFLNGFCYALKRAAIEAVGVLDGERFARGYCEENDYSLRARDAGFALAVAAEAYVQHAKSRSYGAEGRAELARASYAAFEEKHGRERVAGEVAEMEADKSLAPARRTVAEALTSPRAAVARLGERRLSVAFVLPGLAHGGSGGSHSLYQETKALRELGVAARIMLPRWDAERAAAVYEDFADVFETFADAEDLAERTADADVISATHHKSVALLEAIRATRTDFLAAYYVQDYEPFFTPRYVADEAVASYTALPEMVLFAKSRWLCNVVAERHGLAVAKVEPSIDGEVFHARGRGDGEAMDASGSAPWPGSPSPGSASVPGASPTRGAGPLRVAAMVRPRTARRQPVGTMAVLEELLERRAGEVQVSTFGCYADELGELLEGAGEGAGGGMSGSRLRAIKERHLGLLSRTEVAALLRESDVFLDCSIYQAFGRTALEAMACGATAVVPSVGGVWEFVEHEGNALAVDTFGPQGAVAALERLASDRELLERLKAGALATAARYSATRAALSEYVLFERAYRERFGEEREALASAQAMPATALAGE